MSLKTVATFIYWISWLPGGLEISSWTFSNSPFCVDLKNIQFYIIWWNLDWDIVKILEGGHLKSQHFSLIVESFTLALMSNNEPLWQFMTNYEHLLALIGTQEHSRVWFHGAMTTLESSWALMALWPQDHVWHWALMRAQKCPWALIFIHECSCHHGAMHVSVHGWTWAFISIHEYSWAFMSTYKRPWALIIMEP